MYLIKPVKYFCPMHSQIRNGGATRPLLNGNCYCKIALLKDCANIKSPSSTWEYVEWVLLRQENAEGGLLTGSRCGFTTDLLGSCPGSASVSPSVLKELDWPTPTAFPSSSMLFVCDSSGPQPP